MRRSPTELLAITDAPATSAIFSFTTALPLVAFRKTKDPTELVARGGLGGVLDRDLMRGGQVTAASSEPIPGPAIQLRFCSIPSRFSARGAASQLETKGRRAPSAAACAGAVLGLDICIACMVEPCARLRMKQVRSTFAGAGMYSNRRRSSSLVRVRRLPWHARLRYRPQSIDPTRVRPCRHRNRIAGSSRSGSGC